jgi:tetratricopeptide (TPR) repeat protein
MLAHLQHSGAKTCLVDYTLNPLIALWFACTGEVGKDGCVYFIERNNPDNKLIPIDGNKEVKDLFNVDSIYVFSPPNINRRIISQQSVFLISPQGIIDKSKHKIIKIDKDKKKSILDELALVGISRKTLFPDFNGFIEWFSFDNEADKEIYNKIVDEAQKYFLQGDYKKAINTFTEALNLGKNLFRADSTDLAFLYNYLGKVYDYKGEYDEALKWSQKALTIREKTLGLEHPDTAATYNNLGDIYNDKGEHDKALEWHQKALSICEKMLGKNHLDTAAAYNKIGNAYADRGEYDKALEWYQKALAIREKVLGKEHPDTAMSYNNIGAVYDSQGDYAKALEYFQKALAIREKVLGKEHPLTQTVLKNMEVAYNKTNSNKPFGEWLKERFKKDGH